MIRQLDVHEACSVSRVVVRPPEECNLVIYIDELKNKLVLSIAQDSNAVATYINIKNKDHVDLFLIIVLSKNVFRRGGKYKTPNSEGARTLNLLFRRQMLCH
jgi:hypothetical protein